MGATLLLWGSGLSFSTGTGSANELSQPTILQQSQLDTSDQRLVSHSSEKGAPGQERQMHSAHMGSQTEYYANDNVAASERAHANHDSGTAASRRSGGRQQLSSCDHCRSRKKKCDARQRIERDPSVSKCTRCQENGLECSFDFVTQKKMAKMSEIVTRETKNRNKRVKLVSVANARILPKVSDSLLETTDTSPEQQKSPVVLMSEPSIPEGRRSASFLKEERATSVPKTDYSTSKSARSDEEYLEQPPIETLWAPTPPTSIPEIHQNIDKVPLIGEFSLRNFETAVEGQQSHSLARRITGISPELELRLLDEYMDLAYYQLPVFDSDQVYMRYKFTFPSPLPAFLLKTLIALGAAYTCRRPFDKAVVNHLQARRLYDDARQCILQDCIHEASTDAIAALMLITFHWQDELTSKERETIFSISIAKIQHLGLHTAEGLMACRTRREVGQLKMLVWINYVMDAFSILVDLDDFSTKDKWMNMSYLHTEVTIGDIDERDLEFMHIDLLTVLYFEAITGISKLMNQAQRDIEQGLGISYLIPELAKLESESFSVLDFRSMVVEMMDGMYKGLVSLNFTFWYAVLFFNFDIFLPILRKRPRTPSTTQTPELASQMSFAEQVDCRDDLQVHVAACVEAAIAMLDIFEKLQRHGLLAQTSQIVREQLYLGGYVLQLFYRERVGGVSDPLLSRWESCLEISELVWGFSSRGGDLGRMRLEEVE